MAYCDEKALIKVNVLFLSSENAILGIIYSLLLCSQTIFLSLFILND